MVIPHLGILVTTYCNLNCRNCADLIPKRCSVHYPLQDVIEDLTSILENVSAIEEVLVIGGETLLYPWLEEVIDFCGKQEKIRKLIITTNGTIQPKETVLQCLQKNRVCMRVSGYPENVAPNRENILDCYRQNGLEVEDLAGMQWLDMGTFKKRNHTDMELCRIFETCSMKNCVTVQKDGLIFYCSRSLSAYETDIYPNPLKEEYIDVRNGDDLVESFQKFYNLAYLSTCDYCDGVSCATKRIIPTAVQILNKETFLELLGYVCEIQNKKCLSMDMLQCIKDILIENSLCLYEKPGYMKCLGTLADLYKNTSEQNVCKLEMGLQELVNELADDYNYLVSDQIMCAKKRTVGCTRNQITVGNIYGERTEDLLLDDKEIMEELYKRYPFDYAEYNYLYVRAEFQRMQNEKVKCAVCGLSYTQYGIIKENMPINTVNLSVTGQDIPYSLLMGKKALEIQPEINTFLIPMAYYQGYYDISADTALIHQDIVRKVDIPFLKEKRNYINIAQEKSENNILTVYDKICDFELMHEIWQEQIVNKLIGKEYFNEIYVEPCFGGLNFNFKNLTEEERWVSAQKTAGLNERVVTEEGYQEVKKYLKLLLPELTKDNRKVIFFVPPMTKYLYAAYSSKLKSDFEEQIVLFLEKFENVEFLDLGCDSHFTDDDFGDFEHLNHNGGIKLTSILSEKLINSQRKENDA